MSIGKNLKLLRQSADLTQTDLARKSGVDQSMISKIERGEFENPTIDTLRGLAKALGCGIVDLLPEEDKLGLRTRKPQDLSIEALAAKIRAIEARLERMEAA